ncbi:hypothetical protein [Flavicella sp.]|uniref:hypothetical protein n=1 Tax=Flavicella sp. TaxID=2957742 RepID=UPI00261D37B6|nr:hypothetical protein [Flavicella sp.]MDG1805937.1 hypothetical protein [Flavicella sp.]
MFQSKYTVTKTVIQNHNNLHYQIYDPSKSKGTTSEMYPNPKDFIFGDMQADGSDNNKCDK